MGYGMIEIRVNRSHATQTEPQLRNPRPGFTTKSKLLERANKVPKLSPRTCSHCLYSCGSKWDSIYL